MKLKRLAMPCLLLVSVIVFITVLTPYLLPPRTDYGCVWNSYEQEPRDSVDVMFFGSSIPYCDIIPSVIYEHSEITSFVMGGPVQTMAQTYYYVCEAVKTQSPKIIFVELSSLFFTSDETFDLVNINYMPSALNRWKAMFASASPSQWGEMIYPMYRYHGQWVRLYEDGYEAPTPDPLAGYTFLAEYTPFPTVEPKEEDLSNYAQSAEYLQHIDEFCAQEGIRLICYLSPRQNSLSNEAMKRLEQTLSELEAEFTDFDSVKATMAIDPMTDYYDRSHLNYTGAVKFSRFLAQYLCEELSLSKTQNADPVLWQNRIEHLQALAEANPPKQSDAGTSD